MIKLTELLNEMIEESVGLPPGFSANDFQSIEDFTSDKLEEDFNDIGANVRDFPKAELDPYLDRTIGKPKFYTRGDRTGQPVLNKKGKQVRTSLKTKTDKYVYPYIHRDNIMDENGNKIDYDKLVAMIKVRPDHILKQNAKMKTSGGKVQMFYDISLPALVGLVVDEKTNELKIIQTCPNAKECKIFCYALKGGYVQWQAVSLLQTRLLNFLLNDYEGFKTKLISELNIESAKGKYEVVLRWHDAGDFISQKYLDVCYEIARTTPTVRHYFYTKMISMVLASNPPDNVVPRLSTGSKEDKLIKPEHKQGSVPPRSTFERFVHTINVGKNGKKDEFNSKEDEMAFKRLLSNRNNIPLESIVTYDELMNIPENPDDINKWNVIVKKGDGDTGAARKDVHQVFNLIH